MDASQDHSRLLKAKARVPDHVVYRWFEKETLLLNLNTGQYHGLNPTGGRMLQLLDDTDGAIGPAVQRLAEEYEVPLDEIASDLTSFCAALAERGLIEIYDEGG
jgi:Coenzyme PQQ synthesis protein D (PqqD)